MPAYENLSEHDRAVLKSIFDPTATLGDLSGLDDDEELLQNQTEDEKFDSVTLEKVKEKELAAVKKAEEGQHDEALILFDSIIELLPERVASYNNRAQLLRLINRDDDALDDLNKAIELSGDRKNATITQVLCQRGLIMRKQGFNDQATDNFTLAANMGSSFAKKQMVELNPYAALCNQMLKQVLDKEMKK